ncbi:alpha/beta hydrolase family protein [Streptomyces sp. NPDC048751]|uniref:alpha/beta hydrolase family protein n=1 Tax=Streptomyces sp. NPDC048751 TaxID=3365591 RepID=UPI0037227792
MAFAPMLSAWAVMTAPRTPSVADHNPATLYWRDLPVDPDLGGIASERPPLTSIRIGSLRRDGVWPLDLKAALPVEPAWHPRLPLVAGLVRRRRHAVVWIADYERRELTVHTRARAALSLTAHGGTPSALAWCGDEELALLTRPPMREPAGDGWNPAAYEATGPGNVVFLAGLDDLADRAAAAVSLLHRVTGDVRVLTDPLLVSGLTPSPSGRSLLVTHADGIDASPPRGPAGRARDALHWACTTIRTDGPADARPVPTGERPLPPGARWCLTADDLPASARRTPSGTAIRLHPDEGRAAGPTALHEQDVEHPQDDPVTHWWLLGTAEYPVTITLHRQSVRVTTVHSTRVLPLPGVRPLPGRAGHGAAVHEHLLSVACERADQAGVLVVDWRGPAVRAVLVDDASDVRPPAPLDAAWVGHDGDALQLVTRHAGEFRRHVLRGDRLEPLERSVPAPVATAGRATGPLQGPNRRAGAPRRLVLPGGLPDPACLLLPADAPACSSPGDGAPRAARLLWISVRRSGTRPPAPRSLPLAGLGPVGSGAVTAALDLPLDWPVDATVPYLSRQITSAVTEALLALSAESADPGPVVVGGHSFGATVALHALARLPALAGAIVHSGCYNRTLTPYGFQYEERNYWTVPDLYHAFSALHFADRLDRPVLIVHGSEDTNSATPADQAVGLYRAIVATGGMARLLLLPYEGHTFRHQETLRAVTAEHRAWLRVCAGHRSDRRAKGLTHA